MKPHLHPALLTAVMASMVAPALAVDVTLTNGSTQPLTLTAGNNTATVAGTDSATISLLTGLNLTGSQFTKDGTGTLTISNFSTLTLVDLMTVKSGTLILSPSLLSSLLSFNSAYDIQGTSSLVMDTTGTYGTIKLSGTGTLQFTKGGTASIQARSGNTVSNDILFSNSSNACNLTFSQSVTTMSGDITSLNNLTINATYTLAFSGNINVTNTLTIGKSENNIRTFNSLITAGALTMQAGESGNIARTAFTGGTNISGTVTAGAYTNITGSITAQKFLATGGNAAIGANLTISQNIDIDNAGNTMTGTVGAGSVNIYDGGTLNLSGTLNLAASGTITIGSQGSSGTAALLVTGSGVINANTGTITVGRSGVVGSLTIQDTAVVNVQTLSLVNGSVTLSGTGRLNIGSGGIIGSGTINLGAGSTLRAIDNWSSSSTIAFGANAANISSSTFNVTLSGGITGTGSLTKTGSGTLTITGTDKTFTGTSITVSSGTLAMNVSTANILAMAQSYSIASGATLQLNTGTYASALKITGTGNLVFGNGATTVTLRESTGSATLGHNITFGNVASTLTLDSTLTTLQGTLSAGSDLVLNGSQFTTCNGAVNITGKLTLGLGGDAAHATRTFNSLVTAGSLTLQAGTSTIAAAVNFTQDATIAGALTAQGYANLSTGIGKQISAGSYLSTGGHNTVFGRLNINGDAIISGLNDVWTGTVNSANLSINSGASLSMNSSTYTLGAGGAINIGNTGTSGSGTLNITGSSTVNGSTGTIKIGNGFGTAGSLNIQNTSVVNTAGITINNGSVTLSDTASLNIGSTGVSGTGTVNFNGGTTIRADDDWSSSSGVGYAVNGSTASTFNTNGHNVTLNGNISGSGHLNKTGQGTLTISGSDKAFTGTTTATQGTVQVNANMYGTSNAYVAAGGTISISNTGSICTGGSSQAASTVQVTARGAGVNATLANANVTASGIASVDTTGTVKAAVNNAKVTINRTGATIGHTVLNNTTVSLAQNASVTLNDVVLGTGSEINAAVGVAATVTLQNTKLQIVNSQITGTLSSKTVAPLVSADIFNGSQLKVSGQLTVDLSNCHYNPGNHYGVLAVDLGTLKADSDVNIQLTGCDPKWKIITDSEQLKGLRLGTEEGIDLSHKILNEHGIDEDGHIYILVPEPSTATLSLLALSVLAMRRRRK